MTRPSSSIVHPQLMEALLPNFFNRRGAIQEPNKTQSTTGQEKQTWADVVGMTAIPCRIAPAGGLERRFQNEAFLDATDTALLSGTFERLTEQMRFVGDKGNVYDILRVEFDSQAVTTRLTLRTVR